MGEFFKPWRRKVGSDQMKTELVCWTFFALFAVTSVMVDAITVLPEMQTRRHIAERIALTATIIFGGLAFLSRQTTHLRHQWIAWNLLWIGLLVLFFVGVLLQR